ncbi:MAG: gliding motility-associated C-terminal domain-containing protein [bacterium]
MNKTRSLIIIFAAFLIHFPLPLPLLGQTASFNSPDTVNTNQPVTITNTSTGGTTWYWNFCTGNSLSNPQGTNIGNPGNLLNIPGYITLVKDGETCYSFITTHGSNRLVRYNHGKSFSNNPVSWANLGDFGMISDTVQGIKIRNDNGQWFGFVVDNSKIVRLNFGTSLGNTPTATHLGTYSMLYFSHGFDLFNEGGTWIGFLSCSWGNKLVRLNFGNSLMNIPVLTDLGIPGAMNMPTTFCIIKENGAWHAVVVNYGDNTLTRLSFGNSLFNTPTGVNLGNVCPSITAAGIALIRDCESTVGFQLNTSTTSPDLIWRLNFPTGVTGPVTGVSLGNIGAMSQPLRFSELFRVGDTLFLYNTNRLNSSLTRLRFLPCTNASVPSSVLFNPPQYSYSQPGTYNIRLIVDEGLPTQTTFCKSIVVVSPPAGLTAKFTMPDTVCAGSVVTIVNQTFGGTTWYWNFCSGSINDNPTGKNIGNPGNLLNVPTYSTMLTENNECFSFISNQGSQSVIRYDHGSSFATSPSNRIDLGSFGVLSNNVEGIQIKKEAGSWIGFICNYDELVRLNFGTSLKNIPSATVIGPVPELMMAHGFLLINENSEWIGLITCTDGNRLVRVHFGSSLMNTPTFENLGTVGNLNAPGQMSHIIEAGNNYIFVVNLNSSTVSRLDFGNSIKNTPSGVNLGDVCGTAAMGITLLRDCGTIHGFITRYLNTSVTNNLLWKISFPGGLTGPIQTQSLGNIGALERPCLFSELFRQNDSLFVYVSNRGNATRSLLSFVSCNNATPPSSSMHDPPGYVYEKPGIYNIRLLVNEGMPDQSSLCKQIVVLGEPSPSYIDTTLCFGTPWHAGGAWQTQPGIYHDTIHIAEACDSIIQTTLRYKPRIQVSLGNDTIMCDNQPILLNSGVPSAAYQWQDGSTDSTYTAFSPGSYWVIVKKDGCNASDSIRIRECVSPLWFPNVFTPNGDGVNDTFHPTGKGVVRYNILIYDRWGKKIFESDAMEPGWDGKIKGETCSDGVYLFIATFETDFSSGETYRANGTVTVLR